MMGQRGRLTPGQHRIRYAARRVLWVLGATAAVAALVLADQVGLFGRAPATDRAKYHGRTFRVVKVVDGDTLDIDIPDGGYDHTRVRFWGVDTPETVRKDTPVQHFGPEASAYTKSACTGQTVRIELEPTRDPRGRYGRLLAYVFLPDGRMLNRALIEEGCGYADPRFDHFRKSEFLGLQRSARRAGRGLWKDLREAHLPYYWRGKIDLPGKQPAGN